MHPKNIPDSSGRKRIEYFGRLLLSAQLSASQMIWPMGKALKEASDNRISFSAEQWPIQFSDETHENKEKEFASEATNSPLPYAGTTYERLSFPLLIFLLLRSAFHEVYLQLLKVINFTSLPSHCLNVATIVVYRPGDRILTMMIASIILGWHLYQRLFNTYGLTMAHHLLEDENRISEFIGRYFENPGRKSVGSKGIGSSELPVHDRFLRDLMCYRNPNEIARDGDEEIWRVRPNRTLEAREKLSFTIVKSTCIAGILFVVIFMIPMGIWFFFPIFSDYEYVISYPNCDPELDKLFHENKLPWISVTPHLHRLISMVIDMAVVFVFWFSPWALIFACNHMSFLFECDLLAYWRAVDRKMAAILEVARKMQDNDCTDCGCQSKILQYQELVTRQRPSLIYRRASELQGYTRKLSIGQQCSFYSPYKATFCTSIFEHLSDSQVRKFDFDPDIEDVYNLALEMEDTDSCTESSTNLAFAKSSRQRRIDILERHVADLHAQIFDFFTQVELLDAAVSDELTTAVMSWLNTSTAFSFYIVSTQDVGIPRELILAQVMSFLLISSLALSLLSMHRACTKSYVMFCSLMAYDQTSRKLDYIKLMAFFSGDRRRTSFTLFRIMLFTPNTYAKIIGWSITCYFFAYSMVRQEKK